AAELGGARAFFAGRDQQNLAARLHDVRSGGDALNRLVEREVERIPGAGGDDGVHRLFQGFKHHFRHEGNTAAVRLDRTAGEHTGDVAVARERNIDHEIVSGHAGDL